MVATDVVLPGQLVTEFQDVVRQHRRQNLAVFCCRDAPHNDILPCTQWNKETAHWDFVFLNDMDVFIYEMGVFWDALTYRNY